MNTLVSKCVDHFIYGNKAASVGCLSLPCQVPHVWCKPVVITLCTYSIKSKLWVWKKKWSHFFSDCGFVVVTVITNVVWGKKKIYLKNIVNDFFLFSVVARYLTLDIYTGTAKNLNLIVIYFNLIFGYTECYMHV